MRKLINGNFSSISDAELMTKISNNSTGMIYFEPDEPKTENKNSETDLDNTTSFH